MFLQIVHRLKRDRFSWTIVKFAIFLVFIKLYCLINNFFYILVFVLIFMFPIIMKTIVIMEVMLGSYMLGDGGGRIVKNNEKKSILRKHSQ